MKREGRYFDYVVGSLSKFFFILSMMGTIFIGIMVFYNVILRYFFRKPVHWTTEITSLMLVFVTFLGTAYMIRENKHIKFTLIYERITGNKRKLADVINSLAGGIFSFVLCWEAWKATKIAYITNMKMPSIVETPYWIPYFLITIGAFMMGMEFFVRIIGNFGNNKREE